MLERPTPADPEIASALFSKHLGDFWATGIPDRKGLGRIQLDCLHSVIAVPAVSANDQRDWYFVRLGAEFYDSFPPTAAFVTPKDWSDATAGGRWQPTFGTLPPWFGWHPAFNYPDGRPRQLLCFTVTAEYYMVDHSPSEETVWTPGRHTVAATINRLVEVLGKPYYNKPAGEQ